MRHVHNKTTRKYFILIVLLSLAFLAYIGSQSSPSQENKKVPLTVVSVDNITTSTTLNEVTTTVPETTTTEIVVDTTVTTRVVQRTTTTERHVSNNSPIETSGLAGPPRNITTLVGCISYYESTWGDISSNFFQFEQGTWETYGGIGSPSNASYSRQEAVFWLAWEDDGYHHWAAQKGRCF